MVDLTMGNEFLFHVCRCRRDFIVLFFLLKNSLTFISSVTHMPISYLSFSLSFSVYFSFYFSSFSPSFFFLTIFMYFINIYIFKYLTFKFVFIRPWKMKYSSIPLSKRYLTDISLKFHISCKILDNSTFSSSSLFFPYFK